DRVVFLVPVTDLKLPYSIEVALLYQAISPRFVADLFEIDHPEVKRFRTMYEKAGNKPEQVAVDRLVFGD
ncbi:MAG: hypothetical protein AAGD14_07120, partial [Planctomycetota bacterium]